MKKIFKLSTWDLIILLTWIMYEIAYGSGWRKSGFEKSEEKVFMLCFLFMCVTCKCVPGLLQIKYFIIGLKLFITYFHRYQKIGNLVFLDRNENYV